MAAVAAAVAAVAAAAAAAAAKHHNSHNWPPQPLVFAQFRGGCADEREWRLMVEGKERKHQQRPPQHKQQHTNSSGWWPWAGSGRDAGEVQNCTPPTKNYAKPGQWQKSGTGEAHSTTNIWQQHPATRTPLPILEIRTPLPVALAVLA